MLRTANRASVPATERDEVAHQLRLMRDRREENRVRLRTLQLRLTHAAEADTRTCRNLPTTFGRHASDWTRQHEAHFQRRLGELRLDARNEIGAIERKIERQTKAIAAFHLKNAPRRNPHQS
ncbi:hypothetical protein [Novosphingobium sp. HII-3]|uniref:hypothetical protein n=1 Tax=Novosphingobium sp. HII-3 TaxID=2075565 RepID=UPI0011AF36C7|nr:hypothetical protein [Novosphingobium sp. HII-3]